MAVNDVFADEADDGAPGRMGRHFLCLMTKHLLRVLRAIVRVRSALAYATASALRPWRGLMLAVGLHLGVVAVVLLLITAHLPAPPPDGPVISVVMETLPRGSPAPVSQAQAATQVPAPPLPVSPLAPGAEPVQQALRVPVNKPVRNSAAETEIAASGKQRDWRIRLGT